MNHTDQEILDYQRQINQEYTQAPLIGEKVSIQCLEQEYVHAQPVLKSKFQSLLKKGYFIRAVRRDGNCFYRALGYSLCELLTQASWKHAFQQHFVSTKELLISQGYDLGAIEDFYDLSFQLLFGHDHVQSMETAFMADYNSEALVCYFRLMTAASIKSNPDLYAPFLPPEYESLEHLIATQIEPMNMEADQIQISALVNALAIPIHITTLDASQTSQETDLDFSPFLSEAITQTSIKFLYRPGHYDILCT